MQNVSSTPETPTTRYGNPGRQIIIEDRVLNFELDIRNWILNVEGPETLYQRVKLAILHAVEEIKKTNRNLWGKPVPDHDFDWCMAVDLDYTV